MSFQWLIRRIMGVSQACKFATNDYWSNWGYQIALLHDIILLEIITLTVSNCITSYPSMSYCLMFWYFHYTQNNIFQWGCWIIHRILAQTVFLYYNMIVLHVVQMWLFPYHVRISSFNQNCTLSHYISWLQIVIRWYHIMFYNTVLYHDTLHQIIPKHTTS